MIIKALKYNVEYDNTARLHQLNFVQVRKVFE